MDNYAVTQFEQICFYTQYICDMLKQFHRHMETRYWEKMKKKQTNTSMMIDTRIFVM